VAESSTMSAFVGAVVVLDIMVLNYINAAALLAFARTS